MVGWLSVCMGVLRCGRVWQFWHFKNFMFLLLILDVTMSFEPDLHIFVNLLLNKRVYETLKHISLFFYWMHFWKQRQHECLPRIVYIIFFFLVRFLLIKFR